MVVEDYDDGRDLVFNYDEVLKRFMGEKEVVMGVLQIFKEKAGESIEDMKEAMEKQEYLKVGSAAHSLKGSGWNVSAARVANIAGRVEDLVREKKTDDIYLQLTLLEEEFELFCDAIGEYF